MQAVGKLNHNDTDILCHGKKHFTEILRLHFQTVGIFILGILDFISQMKMLQFGYAVHKKQNFFPKLVFHLFFRHHGIFQNIMKKPGSNCFFVQFQFCQNH